MGSKSETIHLLAKREIHGGKDELTGQPIIVHAGRRFNIGPDGDQTARERADSLIRKKAAVEVEPAVDDGLGEDLGEGGDEGKATKVTKVTKAAKPKKTSDE